jgi:ABC-2 type transport system permease protein
MTTDYQAPAPVPDGALPPAAHPQQPAVPSTTVAHALRSEWTKIRTVRSTMWTLGVMLVLVLGIGLLVAFAMHGHEVYGFPTLAAGFYGVLLGCLCVITLGVLVISSEYGTGMIRTTMTACPSRARVLTAKATIFFVVAFVLTTAACSLIALADSSLLKDTGSKPPNGADWLRATLGIGLYVALLGLLALAVGTLLRHSAGAITAMLGVVLLPLILALFMQAQSLHTVQTDLINYSVPDGLATLYGMPFLGSGPHGWDPLWVLLGVTAAALVGAYVTISKRDV